MKRLNKFLKIAILGLLSLVAVDGAAQSATDGTKKVTYTFKGSVLDNSALLSGLFGRKQQLYLKSSGSKPAGVQDPDINCTTDGHVPPVGSSHDGGDFEHYDKHLLGGLSTLYVVEENERAVVRLHNFKYEVARIQWRRRSQHALMTSKGGSWIEDYKGNEAGSFVEYGDEDGLESDYSTNGEIFYHTRDFVNFSETEPYKRYTGISTLNVEVKSKRSYQGIAVQDFDIYYFVPEPKISISDAGTTIVDGNECKLYNVKVVVGKHEHLGAFNMNDLLIKIDESRLAYNGSKVVTFVDEEDADGNPGTDGVKEIHATFQVYEKHDAPAGNAVVYAIVKNGGTDADPIIAGRSQEQAKIKVGTKNGFFYERGKDWYDNAGHSSVTWTDAWDASNITPDLSTYSGQLTTLTFGNVTSETYGTWPFTRTHQETFHSNTGSGRNFRERAIELSYTQDIPAYTDITRKLTFTCHADGGGTGDKRFVEVIDFKEKPISDTQVFENASATNNSGITSSVCFATPDAQVSTNNNSNPLEWYFNNSTGENSKNGVKYLALRGGINRPGTADVQSGWYFEYSNPANAYNYHYYSYVTYDLQGGSADNASMQTISKDVNALNSDIKTAKGGVILDEDIPVVANSSLGVAQKLAPTNLSKTEIIDGRTVEYKFVGWIDKTDGEFYADGAYYNPYDDKGKCGKGPRTLVAQWEEIPAIIGVTFLADGGNVGGTGENYVSKRVTYNHQGWYIDDSHDESNFNAPTATKVGYDFLGYTDMTGLQQFNDAVDKDAAATDYGIYNAGGVLQAGKTTNYITSSKWTSADNVVFYAMFKQKDAGEIASITHTMTLNANYAGAASIAPLTMMTGSQDNNNLVNYIPKRIVEPANASTIDHYMFAGWYTDPSTGDMVYAADGSAVKLVSVTPANLDVYPPVPEKSIYEAYNSSYWNNDATYKYDNDVTLYAHWVAVPKSGELVITFDEGDNSKTNTATWNISDDNGMDTPSYEAVEYNQVIVKRKLQLGKWNTICFPCDIYKAQCDKMFDAVKVLTGIEVDDEKNVMMKFSDSKSITAGVPYFVKMKSSPENEEDLIKYVDGADKGTLTIWDVETGKTASSAVAADGLGNSVTMIGNFVTKYHLTEGLVYLQDDKFYVSQHEYLVSGVNKKVYGNLRGFRCYFDVDVSSTPVKSLTLHLDLEGYDGWTGEDAIEDINAEGVYSAGGGDIYDLSGRQLVGKPQRGLYIVNGRKYISK